MSKQFEWTDELVKEYAASIISSRLKASTYEEALQEFKASKTRPSKEERFWELVNGLSVKIDRQKYPNSIFFFNGDNWQIEYDLNNSHLWLRYGTIWSVFEKEYSLNYNQIQAFIKKLVEEHFKMKGVTPNGERVNGGYNVEEHFKMKGVTPYSINLNSFFIVEEHFKMKGVTPYKY